MPGIRNMSLRKRLLVAVLAIAAVHASFYYIPRWWLTRPRFDEAAWREAVEILKADVGAAAVEKGLFSIPRIPVSTPYEVVTSATMTARDSTPLLPYGQRQKEVWLRLGGDDCAMLFTKSHTGFSGQPVIDSIEACRLGPAEARHVWRVLKYLSTAPSTAASKWEPWPSALRQATDKGGHALWMTPPARTFPEVPATVATLVIDQLRGSCASSYLWGLKCGGAVTVSSSPDANIPEIIKVSRGVMARARAYTEQVDSVVRLLLEYPDKRLLKPLRSVSRRFSPSAVYEWFSQIPALASSMAFDMPTFFEPDYPPDIVDAQIWAIEALAEGERGREALWEAAFTHAAWTARNRRALIVTSALWPDEWQKRVREDFISQNHERETVLMERFYDLCPDDPRVAQIAMGTSYRAPLHLYRITGDPQYLKGAMQAIGLWKLNLRLLLADDAWSADAARIALDQLRHERSTMGGTSPACALASSKDDASYLLALADTPDMLRIAGVASDLIQNTALRLLRYQDPTPVRRGLADFLAARPEDAAGSSVALGVLAEIGDLETAQALRADDAKRGYPAAADIAAVIEARFAADLLAYLVALQNRGRLAASDEDSVADGILRALAARYSMEDLQCLLADERYTVLTPLLYAVMLEKRAEE